MCLKHAREPTAEEQQKLKYGWKVFRFDGYVEDNKGNLITVLKSPYFSWKQTYDKPLVEWYTADTKYINYPSENPDAGFHIFLHKKDAKLLQKYIKYCTFYGVTIRKVEFRNILKIGDADGMGPNINDNCTPGGVLTCKEMRILPS